MSKQLQPFLRRTSGLVCALFLGFGTIPAHAEEGGLMKPLPDGWWHLSMEEIRAGEARDAADGSYTSPGTSASPQLSFVNSATPKVKTPGWSLFSDTTTGGDTDIGSARRELHQNSSDDNSSGTTRDTTLRDYTSATTRALQKGSGGGTNLFRALSPMLPVKNLNVGVFNRPQEQGTSSASGADQKDDADDKSKVPTTTDVIATLPGSSYYSVPSSPLDVVKSSVAVPSSPDPSIAGSLAGNASNTTTTAGLLNNPNLLSTPTSTRSGTNTTTGTSTATASSPATRPSLGWVPGAYPQQGFQPAGAVQPLPGTMRKASGPNSSGFYEPKSITDLQMGR